MDAPVSLCLGDSVGSGYDIRESVVVSHNPPGSWEQHSGHYFSVLQHVDDAALEVFTAVGLEVAHPGEAILPELIHYVTRLSWELLDGHMQVVSVGRCGIEVTLQNQLKVVLIAFNHGHLPLNQQDVRLVRPGQCVLFDRLQLWTLTLKFVQQLLKPVDLRTPVLFIVCGHTCRQ